MALAGVRRPGQAGRLRQGLVGADGAVPGRRAPRTDRRRRLHAGAKFHVASDTPYARYFLAHVLQFQFHRALCQEAGDTGPLYRCSIYGNQKAGAKFQQMLAMGTSKPWPEALKVVTGSDKMDATAMLEYFAPLKTWLDEQNKQLAVEDAKLKR